MVSFTLKLCVEDNFNTCNYICVFLNSCLVSESMSMQCTLPFFGLLGYISFNKVDCRKHFVIA